MSTAFALPSAPDLWKGAIALIGLATLRKVYQLFQYPSVHEIERIANAPIKPLGDNDKITVFGFMDESKEHRHPLYKRGVTELSLYVLRVECFLRLSGIPYTKKAQQDLSWNPRRKLPFANVQGTMIDDSTRIIDHVKAKFKTDPDGKLTEQQLAVGSMIRYSIFGELYWDAYHMSSCTREGRKVFIDIAFGAIPPVIKQLVTALVFRSIHQCLDGQGVARLPASQVAANGRTVVRSIGQLLGSNQYILGTAQPTTYDCDVYSILVLLFNDEPLCDEPWVVAIKNEFPTLVTYVERLKDAWFPELKQA
jgi:Glutathione S-transferase N-terminal domain/Glutathione S-transferase, C-terminal domain